jgi:hypothetical protein
MLKIYFGDSDEKRKKLQNVSCGTLTKVNFGLRRTVTSSIPTSISLQALQVHRRDAMSDKPEITVTATQKNDDDNWYYVITTNGVAGPRVGPYETEEAAIADGKEKLADGDIA